MKRFNIRTHIKLICPIIFIFKCIYYPFPWCDMTNLTVFNGDIIEQDDISRGDFIYSDDSFFKHFKSSVKSKQKITLLFFFISICIIVISSFYSNFHVSFYIGSLFIFPFFTLWYLSFLKWNSLNHGILIYGNGIEMPSCTFFSSYSVFIPWDEIEDTLTKSTIFCILLQKSGEYICCDRNIANIEIISIINTFTQMDIELRKIPEMRLFSETQVFFDNRLK